MFVGGLARLFVLRYESGDVYPPYSSLRADPLGTKALAAALAELPGIEVGRNFKPLPKFHPNGPVTLVYAGVSHRAYWTGPELLAFDSLIANGSRAIFTFFPVETLPSTGDDKRAGDEERTKKEEKTGSAKGGTEKKSGDEKSSDKGQSGTGDDQDKKSVAGKKDEKSTNSQDDEEPPAEPLIAFSTVAKRWGFTFGYLPEEKGKAYVRYATPVDPGGQLESDITWHSTLGFKDVKPQWKVLYMCGKMPVVIERQYDKGSVVLVADSFLVSNEALRGERHPLLLARLFSGPPTIVFDEEHNDLRENPGIASLVRKYRLHGVVAGILLLALLFVWKNVVRFVPAYASSSADGDVVAGKEAGEGFIHLLRRSIAPSAVLDTCFAEWRKAFAHQPRDLAKATEIWNHEQSRPARYRDPVGTYRAISRALARKA
jgi:hypothetical protein